MTWSSYLPCISVGIGGKKGAFPDTGTELQSGSQLPRYAASFPLALPPPSTVDLAAVITEQVTGLRGNQAENVLFWPLERIRQLPSGRPNPRPWAIGAATSDKSSLCSACGLFFLFHHPKIIPFHLLCLFQLICRANVTQSASWSRFRCTPSSGSRAGISKGLSLPV